MNHYFKERIKLDSHNPKQIHNPGKTWKLSVNLGFGTMGRRGIILSDSYHNTSQSSYQ